MKYEKLNQQIIELIGGKENIKGVAHCVTRLRLTLKKKDLAETEKIKQLSGVIDVVSNDVAYQIIIGTHVTEIYDEFIQMIGLSGTSERKKDRSLKGMLQRMLVVVSETMSSIINVLLLAGILASILAILSMTGLVSTENSTYQIFDAIRASIFQFLPVLIAFSASERLKVNPYISATLAVVLLSSTIDGAEGLTLFGLVLPTITYSNTFIPIILAVWLLSVVTPLLEKMIPKSLHFFLVPVLSLIIVLPFTLLIFGPIGVWIGEALAALFGFMSNTIGNWSAIVLYAALQPFLIVTGAASFVMPLVLNFLATQGYDPIFLAAATISDIAVSGAMFGYFLKTKNSKQKQLFGTVSFSALMGITEPAVFGVFVKYRKPFIAVIVGGALGGLVAGIGQVKTLAMAWGLAGLPTYIADGDVGNLLFMLAAVIVGFIGAAVVAYILGIPQEEGQENTALETSQTQPVNLKQAAIGSVAKGTVIPLNTVSDQAFASEALGKGMAIVPDEQLTDIYAPVDGEITVVFPTKHAYGIKTANGIELLIHIGIDTVNLNGEYFENFVQQGEQVQKGEKIAQFDAGKVKQAGFDPTIILVVTNTNDYLDVLTTNSSSETDLLTVVF